jgi:hypothetical protein
VDEDVQECEGVGGVSSQVSLSEISHHCVSWSGRRAIAALRWSAMTISAKSIKHGAVVLGRDVRALNWQLFKGLPGNQTECIPAFMLSTSR